MSKAVASVNRDSLNGTLSFGTLRERERNVPEFVEQKSTAQTQTTRTNTGSTAQQTKRLKIELDVSNPDDILVKEGQTVAANQLIADRQSERSTLTAQLQEVNLSIEKLKAAPKVSQVPPAGAKTLNFTTPQASLHRRTSTDNGSGGEGQRLTAKICTSPSWGGDYLNRNPKGARE